MMMYNAETKDIAKPSELLNSIKAIMSVLQSLENYGVCFSLAETENNCKLLNVGGCAVCGRVMYLLCDAIDNAAEMSFFCDALYQLGGISQLETF